MPAECQPFWNDRFPAIKLRKHQVREGDNDGTASQIESEMNSNFRLVRTMLTLAVSEQTA